MRSRWIVRGIKIVLMMAAGFALFSFLVMRLWNWLAPGVFGWHQISYVQAVGIFILSKILFGGFRGGWGHGRHWRRRITERWEQMTPEEREQFRMGMRGRCGQAAARSTVGRGATQTPGVESR
ncbi:MAG TPA: hypothetical protein VN176_05900 [Verrucomicrobiae bacterium]|jgi:hypothetical protein|nr:hypothetical protein [Verrucomicrobiae bacterium]